MSLPPSLFELRRTSRSSGLWSRAVSPLVNPIARKYSTLPKFGNSVRIAYPGSCLRGDHVIVIVASRACGGRGSVGREWPGQGGLLSVSPGHRADERR